MRYRMLLLCLLLPLSGFAQPGPDSAATGETSLELFFTDGRGRFNHFSPVVMLSDTFAGKTVAHFTRTVNAAGDPTPQPVPPGIYDLTVGLAAYQQIRHIVIEGGKHNKVTVTLTNGGLRFRYVDSAHNDLSRPVREYEATVRRRDEAGPAVVQRCDNEQEYMPGPYLVTINSQPPMHFEADIDIGGGVTQIQFQEPGTVRFSGLPGKFGVTALIENGPFKCPDFFLVSSTAGRPYLWRPGTYELRRIDDGPKGGAVTRFRIYPDKTTDVVLE